MSGEVLTVVISVQVSGAGCLDSDHCRDEIIDLLVSVVLAVLVLGYQIERSEKAYRVYCTAVNKSVVDLRLRSRTEAVTIIGSIADSYQGMFGLDRLIGLSVSS